MVATAAPERTADTRPTSSQMPRPSEPGAAVFDDQHYGRRREKSAPSGRAPQPFAEKSAA